LLNPYDQAKGVKMGNWATADFRRCKIRYWIYIKF
jgi:hypothetical protein